MTRRRKRASAHSGDKQAGPSKPVKKGKGAGEPPEERRCWLCSQPLTSMVVRALFGRDVLEVHQRCYEQALKG